MTTYYSFWEKVGISFAILLGVGILFTIINVVSAYYSLAL